MPQAAIPIIAAIIGAGATIYSVEQNKKAQEAARKAASASASEAAVPPVTPAKTEANYPDVAAAERARLDQLKSSGGGGFSPEFYTQALVGQYPGFEQMANDIVSKTISGGG